MESPNMRLSAILEGKVFSAWAAFLCGMTAAVNVAMAQDLEAGVSSAAGELKRVVKVGLAVAAVIIVAVGLVVTALKFSRKEPDAVWYLLGTGAGSVLCGIASAMM
jgi:hypothetical protein